MGQVLANFYLKLFVRDPKTRKIKNYKDPAHLALIDEFNRVVEIAHKVDIDISIFGIRNLIKDAIEPRVTIRLSNDMKNYHVIEMNQEWQKTMDLDKTRNPNFGALHKFTNIELATEPLCWPFIEIIVEDKNKEKFLAFAGCEDCFTTISLVDFAPKGILSDFELVYAKEQLQRNQDALLMV